MIGLSVSLHPKKTGRVLRPPLTKPLVDGTRGIRIETFCCFSSCSDRS